MSWSITELSRMSGVTSRTLRHYDAIGLLPPSAVGSNGYRYYGEPELLRLQQVLVLRELGLSLSEIGQVLDEQRDVVQALRDQHERLVRERDRLTEVAATVARTITEIEGGQVMTERMFEGFEAEARERWPEGWAQSQEAVARKGSAALQQETAEFMQRMAALMDRPVDDPVVQAEVGAWHSWISQLWTPDAESFAALGRMYVEDERFRQTYEQVAPGLAEFYRDAMELYARTSLG
jgi:DNA-binding transcriptional MerR regulator